MVVGIAGGLIGLGLALPTGMAFGYGYGYGVRAGYNAYKPSANAGVNQLKLSADPIQGALGAGLQSAEERTQAIQGPPQLGISDVDRVQGGQGVMKTNTTGGDTIDTARNPDYIHSPLPGILPRHKDSFKDHDDFVDFVKGRGKYLAQSKKYQMQHSGRVKRMHGHH